MSEEFEISTSGSETGFTLQPPDEDGNANGPPGDQQKNEVDSGNGPPGDQEKKAKLAYDEILALGKSQVDVMQAFRTRGNVILTIATGTAAILSFSDEVQTGAFPGRALTFWAGVVGVVIAAVCVLLIYLPVKWKENPGGVAGPPVQRRHIWSVMNGDYVAVGPDKTSEARVAIRAESASYVALLEEWGEYHRKNYRYNEALLARMGRLTSVAIGGVILLVLAWLTNGYGLPDPPPKSPQQIIVQLKQ